MAELRDRPVLVTGAAGFIGSHLVRRLIAERAEVHGLSRSPEPRRLAGLDARIHMGDITDRASLDAVARDISPAVIIHIAGYSHVGRSWEEPERCHVSNVDGTRNVLDAFDGVYERFVFTGSSEIYGDIDVPFREDAEVRPVSPYALSKYEAERLCLALADQQGRPIVCVRPFNAYGPHQSPDRIIPETIVRALRGEDLPLTSGRQTREFNYVADLVDAFVRVATTPGIDGEVFNLGGGDEVSIHDVVTEIVSQLGNPIEPRFGALEHRPNEIWRMYCDSTKARERLGWGPGHSLQQGLAATIAWYRGELERGSSLED